MSSNVFIFHGTGGHTKENWFPWLREKLEEKDCKIFIPQFPTPKGQSLESWLKVFADYKKYVNEETIIIGHSLGGIFLLRLLECFQCPIKAAIFTGTPIGVRPILYYDGDNSFSGFSFNWPAIKNNAKYFGVFHSDNDPYVSLGNGEQLAKELGVKLSLIPNAGHFNAKAGYLTFPQLLEKIDEILKK